MKEEAFLKDDNIIPLEVTSKYKSITDTNISFFNTDTGTSVLNFIVTKNEKPFEIGLNNAKATIDLKTENYGAETGAHISDDLTFIDPINGRLSYTLPDEFLRYTGKVFGQVFFTQNGSNNIIVMREFSFRIDNDQISNFDGKTKLVYIKTLKDMMAQFNGNISKFNKALGDFPSIIEGVENKVNEGISTINLKATQVETNLNNTFNVRENEFKNKTNGFIENVVVVKDEIKAYIDTAKQEANDLDVLKQGDVVNYQKSKLTTDTGIVEELNDVTIHSVLEKATTTKFVHINNATDAPSAKPQNDNSEVTPKDNNRVDSEYIENDEEELSDIQIINSISSGLLVIYKSENNGRAIWYPDDSNEIYTCFHKDNIWLSWLKVNDETITRNYIESFVESKTSENKQFIENQLNLAAIQKHRLTDSEGNAINIDLDFSQSELVILKTANFYAVKVPDLPIGIENTEGYLRVTAKDSKSKLFEFTPKGTSKNLVRILNNSNLSSWSTFNEERKKVLFDGSVNGVGNDIVLTDDYTKYDFLIVSGIYPGGTFNEVSLVSMPGSIIISKNNIPDSTGDGGASYEGIISKVNNTTLRIANDVFWDLGLRKASGANANKFTVQKIMGWR
ncbi:phage baseplate upper protein [Staphylococcus shinii]|uniref:phage baseplate upper protein n=1 Tax=Staphylococcus shinii TaxID=2912228 RepID=UPI0012FEF025|nr:phage baseplate upper protein [Staphylococcus shinii]